MRQSRSLDEPPVMAAQVALLQRGAEILAARPPMTNAHSSPAQPNEVMGSTRVVMDERTAQEMAGRRGDLGCGRYVRQAAVGFSVAMLVCCVALLQINRNESFTLGAAPVTLSTTMLSQLDWLGGGTYGDPYPADSGSSRRAHLAPAALKAEAGWKQTVAKLFGAAQSVPSESLKMGDKKVERGFGRHNAGRLLSPAKEGERLWREQIKAMQAGELQANTEVMNTVELLKRDKQQFAAVKPKWVPHAVVMLSGVAVRKAAVHARLASLASKNTVLTHTPQAKAAKAYAHKPLAVKDHNKATDKNEHKAVNGKKGAVRAGTTQKLAQPSNAEVLKFVTAKPTDLSALDVATSDSSRNSMSSFFNSLAARDEAKHVLHESRYPRTHSVRAMLPTSIMPAKPQKKEVSHLEKEVSWLRKRVEVLQDAIVKDKSLVTPPSADNKIAGSQKKSQQNKVAKRIVKSVAGKHEKKVTKTAVPPSKAFLALVNPPPRGCPLFAAPGEMLAVDCPR